MTKQNKLFISSVVLASLYLLEFLGTGILIFGKMYNTSPALPVVLTVVAVLPLIFSSLNLILFKKCPLSVALICITIAMALGHFLFTAYALSKLTFLLITGLPVFAVLGIVALLLFMLLAYPKFCRRGKIISVTVLSVIIFCVCVFGILELAIFRFTSSAVVFAVEDEYQIAWSTSVKSTGSVTVNGKTYYDAINGQNRISTLHKISVPMSELDGAGSYTVSSAPVYSEAAYLSVSGKQRSMQVDFRPADTSDGLQIYNVSDNHEILKGATSAGRYFGDKLDVLILNGDIINDVTSLWQISLIYKLAGNITGGERPVIFTRGNHECNGRYADELHEYVGSSQDRFYYSVKLGDAYFLVLDTNNDMKDENRLISPAANFETLREEQADWLENLEYFGEDCNYRFLLSHMAFALDDYARFPEWTERLNTATNGKFDLCISGHSHLLEYSEAGTGTRTDYPIVRGAVRSNSLNVGDGVSPWAFSGTAIECKDGKITATFTNAKGEVLQEIHVN